MAAGLERSSVVFGALAGGAGVALSAVAAHVSGPGSLDVAARFLVGHAPVFVGYAAALRTGIVHRGTGAVAIALLGAGLVLFSGDLTWRVLVGPPPVPMAAPAGGFLLMAGWVLAALAAAIGER